MKSWKTFGCKVWEFLQTAINGTDPAHFQRERYIFHSFECNTTNVKVQQWWKTVKIRRSDDRWVSYSPFQIQLIHCICARTKRCRQALNFALFATESSQRRVVVESTITDKGDYHLPKHSSFCRRVQSWYHLESQSHYDQERALSHWYLRPVVRTSVVPWFSKSLALRLIQNIVQTNTDKVSKNDM